MVLRDMAEDIDVFVRKCDEQHQSIAFIYVVEYEYKMKQIGHTSVFINLTM